MDIDVDRFIPDGRPHRAVIAAVAFCDRRRAKRRRLVERSVSVMGRVRAVERLWLIRPPRFELRAEFGYQGRIYCTSEAYGFRPNDRGGDPVDPNENIILIEDR